MKTLMTTEILNNLENPEQLEKLYRGDKAAFRQAFNTLYPQLQNHPVVACWQARLHLTRDEISWGKRGEMALVLVLALVAGCLAKLPDITGISEEFFYPRNAGFILFPALLFFFAWKARLRASLSAFLAISTLLALVYINWLPAANQSDSLVLACMHLLLLLWCLLGIAFCGGQHNSADKRLQFLRYNGDLLVITALIGIAGGLFTAITLGLFELIGLKIEEFYFRYIVVFGLPAAPLFGTYLVQANPQLVGKVSPVIARIFTPLVLVTLAIYLGAIVYSGKDPYNDREFLLLFNALLIAVMAIIFFSIAGTPAEKHPAETWVLAVLALLTIVVNGIALSAIVFRISEWGLTPNRAAVLGGNILVLVNLLLVAWKLFQAARRKTPLHQAGVCMAAYLPVYFAWAAIVTFLFPLFFGFK